ncbi:unnamed protein product [Orchesella dallaii]|uniref:Transglutaminase-like domain-containing protein n=1 Tax=Orchesella dallaii TaxID=48710 RepID=A0ABP1RU45_9HEXA
MATPTYSGIPYPTSSSSLRRDTQLGSNRDLTIISQRRGSIGQQIPVTSGYVLDSSSSIIPAPSMMTTSGQLGLVGQYATGTLSSGIRGDRSAETATESLIPKRVNQMDMEFQKVKLYDSRKRPDSQNFEESNGAMFSNYLAHRLARVVEDYRRYKYDEARNLNQQFSPSFLGEQQRRASSLSLTQRAGSFTQLNQISASRIEETGPVEIIEWFQRDNGREHRTDRYEMIQDFRRGNPVYRRGQNFFFAVRLASGRVLDLQRTPIFVTFNFGSNPSIGKNTRVCLTVTGDRDFIQRDKSDWDIRVHHQDGNTLTLQVNVSPIAPVGVWSCEIQHGNEIFHCRDDIYILFNPYCSEDPVYLDNEQARREYVHNESGKIYRGTVRNPRSQKWLFSQFNDIVLPMATLFLDRYTEGNRDIIDYTQRGSPVYVSRALASMIFSKFGVLREPENREENFSTFNFTGTHSVFEKLLEQNLRPVETDQSYIASAVYVSCCRALGLPCRSVTSYRAPQDKNSLNIDMYWSEENERESDLYQPYQCWNDVWMRREDLSTATSHIGWQAIDPNNKGYGPAPSEAIRRGEIGLSHNIYHFYSLLNSQIRHFYNNTFPEKINIDEIGRLIVTKRQERDEDDDEYEDITHLYKKKDGTDDERLLILNAVRGSTPRRSSITLRSTERLNLVGLSGRKEDLMIDWSPNVTSIGQPLQVSLLMQNTSNEMRSLVVNLFARPVYQSVVGRKMRQFRRQFTLQPSQREPITLEILPQDYQDRLDDDLTVRFYASVYVKETNQFWAGDEDVTLSRPKMNVQTRTNAQVDSDFPVSFSFVNPLNVTLTDCYIFYEAPGIVKPVFRRCRDLRPGETLNISDNLIPRKSGDTKLLATFNSRQLRNIQGSRVVNVRE